MTSRSFRPRNVAGLAIAAILPLLFGCTQQIWWEPQVVLADGELRVLSKSERRIFTKSALRLCHNACPADETQVSHWLHVYPLVPTPTPAAWRSLLLDERSYSAPSQWRIAELRLLGSGYWAEQNNATNGGSRQCAFAPDPSPASRAQLQWFDCDGAAIGDYALRLDDGRRSLRVQADGSAVRWSHEWSAQSFQLVQSQWQAQFRAPEVSVLSTGCLAERLNDPAQPAGSLMRMVANDTSHVAEFQSDALDGGEGALPGTLAIHDLASGRTRCLALSAPPGAQATRLERAHFAANDEMPWLLLHRVLPNGRFGYAVIKPDSAVVAIDDGYVADGGRDAVADPDSAVKLLAWDPRRGMLVHRQNPVSFGDHQLRLLISDYRAQARRRLLLELP